MVNNITESSLQKSVMQWLKLHDVFAHRNNTGSTRTANGGYISFGCKGSADIYALHNGVAYGIEVKGYDKNGRLGKQSKEQKQWEHDFVKAGGVYILLTPNNFDDLSIILERIRPN
jgi:hypothetical protein